MIQPDVLQAVILGLLAVFGSAGVWNWVATRHRPGLDRETTSIASAAELTEHALAIASRADKRTEELERRMGVMETNLARWMVWGYDLSRSWQVHRLRDDPPTLPNLKVVTPPETPY